MGSGGRRKEPRTCIGYGSSPCPTQADVWTKRAHRCRSCAARHHLIDHPHRGSVTRIKNDPRHISRVRKTAPSKSPSFATFDVARVERALSDNWMSVYEAEHLLGWSRGSLLKAMQRGSMGYYRLDELSVLLGTYVEELVA